MMEFYFQGMYVEEKALRLWLQAIVIIIKLIDGRTPTVITKKASTLTEDLTRFTRATSR